MKKLILFITLLSILGTSIEADSAFRIKDNYIIAYKKYEWITPRLYSWVDYYSKKYKLSSLLVCALIQQESRGRKYLRGKDGEYGYLQVLPVHFKNRKIPKYLRYEPEYNLGLGCWYLAGAMKRARGSIKETIRLYNSGWYGKRHRYRNWAYVNRVVKDYKDSLGYKERHYTSIL